MNQHQANNLCQYITIVLINKGLQPSAKNRLREHLQAIGNEMRQLHPLLDITAEQIERAQVVLHPNDPVLLDALLAELNHDAEVQGIEQLPDPLNAAQLINELIVNYHTDSIKEVYYMEDFVFG